MNRETEFHGRKRAAARHALVLVFALLLLVTANLHAADHDCTGDECPVCACAQQCSRLLEQMGRAAAASAAVCPACTFAAAAVCLYLFFRISDTPILRKVRLND